MGSNDQSSAGSGDTSGEPKNGRTPLKQLAMPRSAVPPRATPLRRRKRIGGKRKVRSCASCRAAHVRCVADRYGVPCERCAKKSWLDCTLMQKQQDTPSAKDTSSDQPGARDINSPRVNVLKQVASDTLTLMTGGARHESS
ncbi:hypothetical protein NUW58_g2859 [Xylaria curta]|uniref:Uncharacterized protein n=1 Tax=Xylaria curta TaxID=42375 RepID=A0ACC1PDK4_9PEZI|nr:hypothetical protein NUW58_g2859 [Xylaria curta]